MRYSCKASLKDILDSISPYDTINDFFRSFTNGEIPPKTPLKAALMTTLKSFADLRV